MFIKKLQIAGLRSFTQVEFTFEPTGINLLVGVNGVGKTTVLDALRICLSRILPDISVTLSPILSFVDSDLRVDAEALQIVCDLNAAGKRFNYIFYKNRQALNNNQSDQTNAVSNEILYFLDANHPLAEPYPNYKELAQQPLAVYFSTRRSLIVDRTISKTSAAGSQAAAFAESLSANRELNLRLFAQWFKAQEELGKENPVSLKHIEVLRNTASEFLPGFQNLHIVETGGKANFVIEKNGVPFPLTQLSDGERGVLAIVLDLARRLSQANPGLEDPVKDGSAIVLIDELDLHLHPKWQRSIVENLTRTFKNCQFIATTHSPQIIGEVKPERITIIGDSIYKPANSFGIDSSRVLEEIMDSIPRNADVDTLLSTLSERIDDENLVEARKLLDQLKNTIGPNEPEVIRSATMIDFLESEVSE